jgi:PHP family Zn ribbon phosphoesterase
VTTRQGFLVEEVILEETTQIGADIVVVGANQQPTWRRILRRLLQNDPEVSTFLRAKTTPDTEVMEVDTTAETPAVNPV